jgi:hypothetical protein
MFCRNLYTEILTVDDVVSEADEVRFDLLKYAVREVSVSRNSEFCPSHPLGNKRFNRPGRTGSEVYAFCGGKGTYG